MSETETTASAADIDRWTRHLWHTSQHNRMVIGLAGRLQTLANEMRATAGLPEFGWNTSFPDAEFGECDDQRFFHLAQIPVQILLVPAQVHDRVADELARPVEGDVAAALRLEQLDAARREEGGRRNEILRLGAAPERDHGRMLEQEQHIVRDLAADPRAGHRALELEPARVGDEAEVHDVHRRERSVGVRRQVDRRANAHLTH